MFGSEEAFWAIHYTAYGRIEFEQMMKCIGFNLISVKYGSWKNTYNIDVIAKKEKAIDLNTIRDNFKTYLSSYCVNESEGEIKMLDVWMDEYDEQIRKQIHVVE